MSNKTVVSEAEKKAEAERLGKLFADREIEDRVAFAKSLGGKLTGSLIYQHLNWLRPINLDHALEYCRGLRCTINEISPRLAKHVQLAATYLDRSSDRPLPDKEHGDWPFETERALFDALPEKDKHYVDVVMAEKVKAIRSRKRAA